MSLSRLALRLAMVETLAPSPLLAQSAPAWPTLAADMVADSQLPRVPVTEEESRRPYAVVYTEDSKADAYERQAQLDHPHDGVERVTLAVEMSVPGVSQDETGAPLLTLAAETDAIAEAMLDVMCQQVADAIAASMTSGLLRFVLIGIEKIESRTWRDADTDTRLSSRRDEYEVRIRRSGPPLAGGAGLTGLALALSRLPSPLADIAAALPQTGACYARTIAETVATLLATPAALPALTEIRIAAALKRDSGATPPADPAVTPPAGDAVARIVL